MHLQVTVADPGQAPTLPPLLFLDQTEARRAGKNVLESVPPPLNPDLKVWIRH